MTGTHLASMRHISLQTVSHMLCPTIPMVSFKRPGRSNRGSCGHTLGQLALSSQALTQADSHITEHFLGKSLRIEPIWKALPLLVLPRKHYQKAAVQHEQQSDDCSMQRCYRPGGCLNMFLWQPKFGYTQLCISTFSAVTASTGSSIGC